MNHTVIVQWYVFLCNILTIRDLDADFFAMMHQENIASMSQLLGQKKKIVILA